VRLQLSGSHSYADDFVWIMAIYGDFIDNHQSIQVIVANMQWRR
jgi:hypothetical protein